jgi:hypothetical protein
MGDKCYWFDGGQKGNFSNEGKDTFDPTKDYIGIRLQQGVPLLDRDWNELEDIRRYQEMALRRSYLGNGTPDDGFKISALDPPANDFRISEGRMLVDGFEAVNEQGTAAFKSSYSEQKDLAILTPLQEPAGIHLPTEYYYLVYLDLWIDEVTGTYGADSKENQDPALDNSNDVHICTAIRHRVQWRIRAKDWEHIVIGNTTPSKEPWPSAPSGHHFIKIARIKRSNKGITDGNILDLRQKWQSLSFTSVLHEETEKRFRGIINSLLRGDIPSDSEINLTSNGGFELIKLIKDSRENIYLFFNKDDRSYFKALVSNKWLETKPLYDKLPTTDKTIGFADTAGNIWLFGQEDKNSNGLNSSSISFVKISKVHDVDKPVRVAETNVSDISIALQFVTQDNHGDIHPFWLVKEGTREILYSREWDTEESEWANDPKKEGFLPSAVEAGEKLQVLGVDHYLYFFWLDSDHKILGLKYDGKKLVVPHRELTKESKSRSHLQVLRDINKNIWLFWKQDDGIFSIKWDSKTVKWDDETKWEKESKIVDAEKVDMLNVVGDKGRIWLFWRIARGGGFFCKVFFDGWNDETKVLDWLPDERYSAFLDSQSSMWLPYLFLDSQSSIWLPYQRKESKNIWCKRYISGEWVDDMRLLSDETPKNLISMFEGQDGDAWLFWRNANINDPNDKSGDIWCKRCYGSV